MDDDWDAEDFVPPPPIVAREQPKSQWDDEDKEEEAQVKESWEDDEKPEPAPKAPPKAEKVEKKGKKSVTAAPQEQPEEHKSSDPLAEKLRQQRLVEQADFQVTTELFGKEGEGRPFEGFLPKSEADFIEYAELIARELRNYESSYHYLTLLKSLLKASTSSMKAADVKEIASAVTVIANEKLKAEKEASTGKKKGGTKKKQLHVDKAEEDNYSQAYDDVDEFDFM